MPNNVGLRANRRRSGRINAAPVVLSAATRTFSVVGTAPVEVPAGYSAAQWILHGAGGGGSSTTGGGGGGGACAVKTISLAGASGLWTLTIGQGGTSKALSAGSATDGGDTTLTGTGISGSIVAGGGKAPTVSVITAPGGTASGSYDAGYPGGSGGTAANFSGGGGAAGPGGPGAAGGEGSASTPASGSAAGPNTGAGGGGGGALRSPGQYGAGGGGGAGAAGGHGAHATSGAGGAGDLWIGLAGLRGTDGGSPPPGVEGGSGGWPGGGAGANNASVSMAVGGNGGAYLILIP